jgi:hypothetical protein
VEVAEADAAEVVLVVMAVEAMTVKAEAGELLETTIRRLHHHYACRN